MKKKLIPCIYLKNKMAVAGFNDATVIETDPLRLVSRFCEAKADEILVFDLSKEEPSNSSLKTRFQPFNEAGGVA